MSLEWGELFIIILLLFTPGLGVCMFLLSSLIFLGVSVILSSSSLVCRVMMSGLIIFFRNYFTQNYFSVDTLVSSRALISPAAAAGGNTEFWITPALSLVSRRSRDQNPGLWLVAAICSTLKYEHLQSDGNSSECVYIRDQSWGRRGEGGAGTFP